MRSDRRICLGCSGPLPGPFLDLGAMPLANALIRPEQANEPQATFPLAVAYCPACHLVQLTEQVSPKQMFTEYLYFSSYSDSFLAHAREMAESLIARFDLGKDSRVLEIGSNDGYLLQFFQQRGVPVLGVEPAKNVAEAAGRRGIPTLNRFFGPDVVEEILGDFGKVDLIIGNNVLAHIPEINGFLSAVRRCLAPTGAAVFEFPYIQDLLDGIEFDTIYHEHVFYYSLSAVSNLAERAALALFDVSHQPVHGGSLRIFLQAGEARPLSGSLQTMLAEERQAGLTGPRRYAAFSENVTIVKEKLVSLLRGLKAGGKRLAAYGAPAKGNILLNYCQIGRDLLDFTVDRNPMKQGLLTPGARLPIRPPHDLLAEMPDYTVILPWNIADEILDQQAEYRRRGGQFIIPLPEARIV
jgi:SAM-dependent methyltransferase